MPVFDTSALLPLFNLDHPHYARATKAFNAADRVILHPCVIQEFTTVLRRLAKDAGEDGNRVARRALVTLLQQPRVQISAEMDYGRAVEGYLANSTISFTDAVVVESKSSFDKTDPIAFDEGINKAGKLVKARRATGRKPPT